ncbi:MAG: hypothetical protein V1853_01715 [bacterium]
MTTSTMTEGQINRACEIFRAQLTRRASELSSDAVQEAFGDPALGSDWFAVLQKRVDLIGSTFTATVNYDDPQWRTIERSRYANMSDVKPKDYPVGGKGSKPIKYRLLEFDHDPLDDEVLAKMAEMNCRQPDRAESETIIRSFTAEELRAHPVIGLIGPAVKRNGNLLRAYVDGYENGVNLVWSWTGKRWSRYCHFVAVCK